MDSTTPLPPHLAERATSIKAKLLSQLPAHSILFKNVSHPLDSTTLIPYSARLKPRQLEILDYDAVGLVEALGGKRYTAVEVIEAYAISAAIAQQATNCLTWYDLDSARRQAKELDRRLEETGRVVGPLHGVVISIKRQSLSAFPPRMDPFHVRSSLSSPALFLLLTTSRQGWDGLNTFNDIRRELIG